MLLRKTLFSVAVTLAFSTKLIQVQANPHKNHDINILTWWGYFDYDNMKERIEKECRCKLHIDSYFSNHELIRRLSNSKSAYDLVIFSDAVYPVIKKGLFQSQQFSDVSENYHPKVRARYQQGQYPSNMRYFALASTVFLYNTNNVQLDPKDAIDSLLQSATNKSISILDDYREADLLFGGLHQLSRFESYFKNLKLFIGNDPTKIAKSPDFAWAQMYSGGAQILIDKAKLDHLAIELVPKLSHISLDFVAALNRDPLTQRVFDIVSSADTIKQINLKLKYYSPYGKIFPNNKFEHTFFNSSEIPWLELPNDDLEIKNDVDWQVIRTQLLMHL